MRTLLAPFLALAAVLATATSGPALEKTARVFDGEDLGDWNASTTCSVGYYNICTGWIWIWSGFADGEVLGTIYEGCCGSCGALTGTYLYYWTGAPAGRGFTGTHAIYAVDPDDCPVGAALSSQPWMPSSGWNLTLWSGVPVPSRFLIMATIQDDLGFATSVALPSDGPSACGVCYPTTRTTNSYLFGHEDSPLCPGSPLHDGHCYVEWLGNALMSCVDSIEEKSWGAIKNLYR